MKALQMKWMEKGTNKMPRAKANANMTLKELRASYARRISELEAKIAFIDQMMASGSDRDLPGVPTTERKKPGPKPGWKNGPKAKKVAQTAAPKKKPGPKPKAQKAQAKPPTKKAASQPTKKGPSSSKPRLIDAIQQVMGTKTMNALEIHGELKKRHWLPNSDDPLGYIRYTLSANKEIFLRVEGQRGHYHLDKGTKPAAVNGKAAKPAAAKKTEPAATTAPAAEPPKVEPPKVVPPPVVKAAEPPKVESKPAGEDEDPAAVADDILSRAGIDLGGLT